jgi:hypothetical protein
MVSAAASKVDAVVVACFGEEELLELVDEDWWRLEVEVYMGRKLDFENERIFIVGDFGKNSSVSSECDCEQSSAKDEMKHSDLAKSDVVN